MKRATGTPLSKLIISLVAIASFIGTASPALVNARVLESSRTITDNARVALDTGDSFFGAALVKTDITTVDASHRTNTIMLAGTAVRTPGAIKTVKKPEPKPEPVVNAAPTPAPVVRLAQASTPAPTPTPAPAPALTPPAPSAPDDGNKSDLPSQNPGITIQWGGPITPAQMGYGFCTEHVAKLRRNIGWFGNANQWPANAAAAGYKLGNTPVYGAILVTNEGPVGHVAFVTSVNYDNKTFTISEQNYAGWNVETTRTLSFNAGQIVTFIY